MQPLTTKFRLHPCLLTQRRASVQKLYRCRLTQRQATGQRYLVRQPDLEMAVGSKLQLTNFRFPYNVDFVDYAEELEKPEELTISNGSYEHSTEAAASSAGVAKKLSFVPESFSSPLRTVDVSSDVFKAYDFDKTFTPKLSKTEFEFNDAHSPVSASKYIERSLHDLDDLINLRRLELSELKRSHSQRPGGAQEFSNPLHQAKNSASKLNTPLPVSADGSPNPAASPSVSLSLHFDFIQFDFISLCNSFYLAHSIVASGKYTSFLMSLSFVLSFFLSDFFTVSLSSS